MVPAQPFGAQPPLVLAVEPFGAQPLVVLAVEPSGAQVPVVVVVEPLPQLLETVARSWVLAAVEPLVVQAHRSA